MKGVVVGLLVVLGLLGGFYGGMKYGQAHAAPAAAAQSGTGGGPGGGLRGGPGGGGGFAPAVSGPIVSVGNGTVTVQDRTTGKNITVNLPSGVRITKTTQGSTSDLTQNTNVTVIGQTGSDGSVNAQAIQVGNGGLGFGRGRRASPSPAA